MPTTRLPDAWAASSPWTHRTRRAWLGWLPPWAWVQTRVQRLPRGWRYYTCMTEAPASLCRCGLYRIQWPGKEEEYAGKIEGPAADDGR
jgi:hypothetical protein